MKSDVLTLISAAARSRPSAAGDPEALRQRSRVHHRRSTRPQSIDDLTVLVRDALNDRHLEISKVRPFFWSLVETYADRFRSYPFNTAKALLSDLEMRDFPEAEMEMIVDRLEKAYEMRYGKPMPHKRSGHTTGYVALHDDLRDLADSLNFAALVDKIEEDEDEERVDWG